MAAIVALGALVFATGAQACSCVQVAPGEALRRADAALVGELIEIIPQSRLQAAYRYRVQRVYRGPRTIERGEVISVRSARQSAACGLPSQTGRRYGLLLDAASVVPGGDARQTAGTGWTGGLCGVVAPRELRSMVRGSSKARRATGSAFSSCAI